MYGWNNFSFKNVLGAAYNQVRFIVRNLRYIIVLFDSRNLTQILSNFSGQ